MTATRLQGSYDPPGIPAHLTPEAIVHRAWEAEGPWIKTYCLFSGGHDSTTTAHRCRDLYDELAFIDTGTALPGVREFVIDFAKWVDKPLRILDSGDAYRIEVLGSDDWWEMFYEERQAEPDLTLPAFIERCSRERRPGRGNSPQGFPGPGGGHRVAYARLKERQVERLVRETKVGHSRMARVGLITGARRHESRRRMITQGTDGFRKREGKAQVWINPLNEWKNEDMRRYRREVGIPESDVAAMLHRSGECNCGSFAGPREREELQSLYPDWWESVIAPLEREAAARGIPRCRWGERADSGRAGAKGINDETAREEQPLCSDCIIQAGGEE